MKKLKMKITLKSDALLASGEGYGAIIDTDIVFDDLGIPYIPAKRIKGCLRDSMDEINDMFHNSNVNYSITIDNLFGNNKKNVSSSAHFDNLYIKDYDTNFKWIEYFQNDFKDFISSEITTSFFTSVRQQTSIDENTGVTKEHSLRISRVLKKGIEFFGDITLSNDSPEILNSLILACINLRHIGSSRTRGFGEVVCEIYDEKNKLLNDIVLKELEAICKK